ncbi:MAG: FAD-dependent oxidoreductase [Pseudomonadota bacterium]
MENTLSDLRKGETPWTKDGFSCTVHPEKIIGSLTTDILIIGAGITGAFLAEIFSRTDKKVVVVDRHHPQTASTMASTSLLQWEIDAPLVELADYIGLEKALKVYRQSFASVDYISQLVAKLGIACDFAPRKTLYLEGNKLNSTQLHDEFKLREQASFPCQWLDKKAVAENYGFDGRAAIHSAANAEADPVLLARGLLNTATQRGALVLSPANAGSFDFENHKVHIRIEETGLEIIADTLILASGYEMPPFVKTAQHEIVSTWAICTVPQMSQAPWHEKDLVWESADPYFYMRTTTKNEIIIGGEDEEISDADKRDVLLPEKTLALQNKLQELLPHADTTAQYAWCAFFGTTEDSLPLIGNVPDYSNVYAAYGYGGNGITFSALAAQLLSGQILAGKKIDPAYMLER